jgi:P27 family predicted phage terminase small subunit
MARRLSAADREAFGTRSKAHTPPRYAACLPRTPHFAVILGDELVARDARREWHRLAPALAAQGLLAAIDEFALTDLCCCAARIRQAERAIALEGLMVCAVGRTDRGQVRHPLLVALNQYRAHYQRLCRLFGIGPASRQGLDALKPPSADNPLAPILRMTARRSPRVS